MSKSMLLNLDRQTDIAIAMGTAVEVWFFNGKVCFIALRH